MNAFALDYIPQIANPTQRERAAASSARKTSAMNQKRLDAFGPSTSPTAEQKLADQDRNRAIRAGRGI